MELAQALRVRRNDVIAFVGAGGKTTAMFRLARELNAQNQRVIITTTTHIFAAQAAQASDVMTYSASSEEEQAAFVSRAAAALAEHSQLLIAGPVGPENKAAGIPPALVDRLAAQGGADVILVEADGARMRPFKAPAEHEPVLPGATTLLVPVVGVKAIGSMLDDEHVHRADIAARLAGARVGETVTPTMVARVVSHSEGGLKGRPAGARTVVLVNQVEGAAELESARALARLLLGYEGIEGVAVGAVRAASPIQETHRRLAAIVLAAGAGTRMEGSAKQLLLWRGKTLIERAAETAARSSVTETVVVLGARADELRTALAHLQVRIIINRNWAEGRASSIRAGLRALSPAVDAAVFVNADQPFLTSAVVDAILQRYRETDAPIVTPVYAGRRGSPVLFAQKLFGALMNLEGEQGGRELLAARRDEIRTVEFDDEQFGFDVDTPEDYARLRESP